MTILTDRERALRAVAIGLAEQASRIRLQLALLAVEGERGAVVQALETSAGDLSFLVRRLADVVEPEPSPSES
ncbi:MAG TPA: hypothetical protein VM889_05735 [Candidatus Thermoplasmatota archaeon]|nr:hypothetical protein [Candidatus Thermoplasmatota archaeon]